MSRAAIRTWSPWGGAGGRRAVTLAAAGHGLWLLGWWMASREAAFSRQMPGLNLAVVGLVVVAYADVTWLQRSHRRITDRRRMLLDGVGAGGAPEQGFFADPEAVVSGPDRGFFHRPGCRFAAGRDWPVVDRPEAARDQQPCGVCRP